MLNFYKLDTPKEEIKQIDYYEKCKYYIKISCPFTTFFINIIVLMLNIFFILPYISNYYNSNDIGYIIIIAINSVFIVVSIIICLFIIFCF